MQCKRTCALGGPAAASQVEGGHAPDGGAQDAPAEHGHRVRADQLAHKRSLAAPQQRHDVGAHVIRVFLAEILPDIFPMRTSNPSVAGGVHNKLKDEKEAPVQPPAWLTLEMIQ